MEFFLVESHRLEFFHFDDLIMSLISLLVIGVIFIFGKVHLCTLDNSKSQLH
jgi:hypothetical protein